MLFLLQASFLPACLPHVPGWQLVATLDPARETSGDFYDVIPLPDGQLGLLIADVADKGMGAALYMALSRTLIRTYATQHQQRPERVLQTANRRILQDSRADLFVTVFYGVLDPVTGTLTYCNAGHNPPYLFSARNGTIALRRTGMALGVLEEMDWGQKSIQIAPGRVLVLYTDGITEAQDTRQAFFGEERLLETLETHPRDSAQDVHDALVAKMRSFVGDAPQFDDTTLMIVMRDAAGSEGSVLTASR